MEEKVTITYNLNEDEIKAAIIKSMPKKKILASEIGLRVTDVDAGIIEATIKHEVI